MKKILLALLISAAFYKPGFGQVQNNQPDISIIPQPVSVSLQKGYFLLKPQAAAILADKNAADVAAFLSELPHEDYGFPIKNNERKCFR